MLVTHKNEDVESELDDLIVRRPSEKVLLRAARINNYINRNNV